MPRFLAAVLVFVTSAAVLVLEILAGRVLAPYVGDTLQTYTGIIGTVLAGIALGTWIGGLLADRVDPRKLLGPEILLGGILSLLILPVIAVLGPLFAGRSVVSILVLSVAGLLLPAAVLSTVTPTVIKLQLHSLDETGSVVGQLSALGTAGAIVGTFATGFVLIAAFPTRPIVLAIGGALVALGAGLWLWLGSLDRSPVPLAAVGLLAALLTGAANVPCELESAYYCAQVIEDPDRDSGRTLLLDALSHSYVDVDDPTHLEFAYTWLLAEVLAVHEPDDRALRALHIGGGGFTLPTYIAATRPGARNVVIEVDPALIGLAEEELGLETGPGLDVVVGDARLEVGRTSDSYDIVVGDAFGGLAVPWHLTTAEFVDKIAASLEPSGLYAVNIIDYPPLDFAKAHAATLDAVFAHTAVLAPRERLAAQSGGNFVMLGADDDLRLDDIRSRSGDWDVLAGEELRAWIGDASVLTDDFAPVDQLLTVQ